MTSEILQSLENEHPGSDPHVVVESVKDPESGHEPSRPVSDKSRCESDSAKDHELSGSMPAQSRRKMRKSHYVAPPPSPEMKRTDRLLYQRAIGKKIP
jgi:hypothetical protein